MSNLINSFRHALRGVYHALLHERNFRLQLVLVAAMSIVAVLGRVPVYAWAVFMLVAGGMLAAELFNTAVERLLDLVEPRLAGHARTIKDLLAAAVLVFALVGTVAVVLVFSQVLLR